MDHCVHFNPLVLNLLTVKEQSYVLSSHLVFFMSSESLDGECGILWIKD